MISSSSWYFITYSVTKQALIWSSTPVSSRQPYFSLPRCKRPSMCLRWGPGDIYFNGWYLFAHGAKSLATPTVWQIFCRWKYSKSFLLLFIFVLNVRQFAQALAVFPPVRERTCTYNCYLYVYIIIRHMLLCSPLRLDFLPLWLCTTIIQIEEVAWSSSSTAAVCWYTVLLFDKYHSAGMFGCLWYSFLPKPLSCAGDSNAFWFTLQLAILR